LISSEFPFNSNFAMTKSLATIVGEWNEAEIDKCQQQMAEMAVNIWPIKPPSAKGKKKGK